MVTGSAGRSVPAGCWAVASSADPALSTDAPSSPRAGRPRVAAAPRRLAAQSLRSDDCFNDHILEHLAGRGTLDCIPYLAIAITFFYRQERLAYLRQICRHHANLATRIKTFVITNTNDAAERALILEAVGTATAVKIVTPTLLGHPLLLAWIHRDIFKKCLMSGQNFSHYLYTEDDMLVTQENVNYWLHGMKILAPSVFIPGFMRYEVDDKGTAFCTDLTSAVNHETIPKIIFANGYSMISIRRPYQGMYLLDQTQMAELLLTPASSPDYGYYHVRESAAQGLSFYNVPAGANSRNLVGVNQGVSIDPGALIWHLPNSYVQDQTSKFGRIRLDQVFDPAGTMPSR